MEFMGEGHREKVIQIMKIWDDIGVLSQLAASHGINDIFQDNGAKILQQLIILNFKNLPGREGNDAIDKNGIEWEMKSCNESLVSGFSTHHHLNFEILKKYREVPWSFAFYNHSILNEIYVMSPLRLEPMYQRWEDKLSGRVGKPPMIHINNPKIPLKFVRSNGIRVYPFGDPPIDPAEVVVKEMRDQSK